MWSSHSDVPVGRFETRSDTPKTSRPLCLWYEAHFLPISPPLDCVRVQPKFRSNTHTSASRKASCRVSLLLVDIGCSLTQRAGTRCFYTLFFTVFTGTISESVVQELFERSVSLVHVCMVGVINIFFTKRFLQHRVVYRIREDTKTHTHTPLVCVNQSPFLSILCCALFSIDREKREEDAELYGCYEKLVDNNDIAEYAMDQYDQ